MRVEEPVLVYGRRALIGGEGRDFREGETPKKGTTMTMTTAPFRVGAAAAAARASEPVARLRPLRAESSPRRASSLDSRVFTRRGRPCSVRAQVKGASAVRLVSRARQMLIAIGLIDTNYAGD